MKLVRKIHKWVSLIVGLQLLIWLATGLYFNLMDHHKAGGHQYRAHQHAKSNVDVEKLVEISEVLANAKPATSVKQIELLAQPYYLVNHEKGLYANFENRYSLFDGFTGEKVKIDREFAKKLALNSYNGPGEVVSVRYLGADISDFPKQKNPSWQVGFNDDVETRVYVEAESGRIVGHSDSDKRLADFFFMLHFMDYAGEGSFNNWFMFFFAFAVLWLSTTGFIWTLDLLRRGQFKFRSLFS